MSHSSENFRTRSNHAGEKTPAISLVASFSGIIPHKALNHVVPLKALRGIHTDQIVLFLFKVAALETVRRLSKARCPFVWRVVQALQVLGYPPFKWIQRWGPLRIIVKGVQKFSRPLLVLSIATAFSDHSETCKRTVNSQDVPQPDSELPDEPSDSDIRKCDDASKNIVPENWSLQILKELEKEGISLPERIDKDELCRFYTAAKGDISCLLSSLKKTIRWRETYHILSSQELEMWSNLVFWHGFDVMLRPCLVIRLGLACSSLLPQDRPRFAQAVVSQVEHGVFHLVNEADPRITVLMDCEGLSPIRFPMQMMKTCSTLVQDHYPNRLGTLFVIRLPPVSRVIAQTFIKVLKPATRQKLRVEGEAFYKVLSEFLRTVPAFLGGKCTCSQCRMLFSGKTRENIMEEIGEREIGDNSVNDELSLDDYPGTQTAFSHDCDHVLRAAIVGILMLCIVVTFFAGMYDPDSGSSLPL